MKRFVRLATTTALACLLAATSVHAHAPGLAEEPERRALTLDEVLALETFGAAALSPDGQWVAWERRRPYETAPRFDRNHRTGWAVTDLMIARTGDGAPEPLLPGDQTAGLLLVSWSPDSRRLLVHRLRGGDAGGRHRQCGRSVRLLDGSHAGPRQRRHQRMAGRRPGGAHDPTRGRSAMAVALRRHGSGRDGSALDADGRGTGAFADPDRDAPRPGDDRRRRAGRPPGGARCDDGGQP